MKKIWILALIPLFFSCVSTGTDSRCVPAWERGVRSTAAGTVIGGVAGAILGGDGRSAAAGAKVGAVMGAMEAITNPYDDCQEAERFDTIQPADGDETVFLRRAEGVDERMLHSILPIILSKRGFIFLEENRDGAEREGFFRSYSCYSCGNKNRDQGSGEYAMDVLVMSLERDDRASGTSYGPWGYWGYGPGASRSGYRGSRMIQVSVVMYRAGRVIPKFSGVAVVRIEEHRAGNGWYQIDDFGRGHSYREGVYDPQTEAARRVLPKMFGVQ